MRLETGKTASLRKGGFMTGSLERVYALFYGERGSVCGVTAENSFGVQLGIFSQ